MAQMAFSIFDYTNLEGGPLSPQAGQIKFGLLVLYRDTVTGRVAMLQPVFALVNADDTTATIRIKLTDAVLAAQPSGFALARGSVFFPAFQQGA